jgi:glucose-6-phosphate 1-dehydrogenase
MVTLALTRARTMRHDVVEDAQEQLRFRLGPGAVAIDVDTTHLRPGTADAHECVTLHADLPADHDRDAYVNLLGAALAGDRSMSERASGVTAAWRVVEDVLHASVPVHGYRAGSWGPDESARLLRQGERWIDPPAP